MGLQHNNCILDRINLNNDDDLPKDIYNQIYSFNKIFEDNINKYDVIFICDLFENITIEQTCEIINKLLTKTNKSIIVMTPLYPYDKVKNDGTESKVREYHPIAFSNFDFSYYLNETSEGSWQFYSFYPYKNFKLLDSDKISIKKNYDRSNKLNIAYVLPHRGLTGGMKALLEHIRQLSKRGHKVYVYLKSNDASSVIPEWSDLDVNKDIEGEVVVPLDRSISEYIKNVDIIMVGWMCQLPELTNVNIPVVLWEQGYEGLYGDYGKLLESESNLIRDLRNIYRRPVYMLGVSKLVTNILKNKYGRKAHVLPNGIDTSFYYPLKDKVDGNKILLVGNPSLSFKGFNYAIKALQKAYDYGARFTVNWACQTRPIIKECSFPINLIVMASQEKLADLYRNSDIFLSTSLYEAFSLPAFEAMASGVPVIAMDCGGIKEYAKPGENILLSDQGDVESLSAAIIYLLNNPNVRHELSDAGIKTISEYSFEKIALILEDYLYSIVSAYDLNKKRGES